MPICTVDRKRVGSSCSAIASAAPGSFASTMTCSLALRLAASAVLEDGPLVVLPIDMPQVPPALLAALARARDAGVTDCIVPAYDPASWDAVAALSRRDGVHAAYGLHPWVAGLALDTDALRSRLVGGACAIGEIGLDFKIPDPDREAQIDVFRRQLDLAAELDLDALEFAQQVARRQPFRLR